ncbi:MAG: TIGR00289 family protein [Candidatus Bathyarchaeota archaeon]|nr:MAG: TIGR00289 family protein [Candidatus Bathyarchaeota archaeon]
MKVAALISGGKDSALALHHALMKGYNVTYLVSMVPQRDDSWMFHHLNIHLTSLFAESARIPIRMQTTAGVREEELLDLKNALASLRVEGVVSGAVASTYQKERIEKVCEELGLQSIMPLWNRNPQSLLTELLALKFKIIITGVFAHGFTRSWLGREITREAVRDLLDLHRQFQISVIGEGGEFETLVLDAPFFEQEIEVVESETVWKAENGHLHVTRARLHKKPPSSRSATIRDPS